jgi:hypothetical protein
VYADEERALLGAVSAKTDVRNRFFLRAIGNRGIGRRAGEGEDGLVFAQGRASGKGRRGSDGGVAIGPGQDDGEQ